MLSPPKTTRDTPCHAAPFFLPVAAHCRCRPAFADGDGDGERAALARLVGEIDQLAPLLKQAEAQADPKDRVRFGYGWLRSDLEKVKAGIRVHLDRPWTGPASSPRPSSRCAGSTPR